MFKKSLSLFLSVIMLLSCFAAATSVSAASIDVKSIFTVKAEPVSDNKLTYTIGINPQQKGIAGIVLLVKYDDTVLEPVNCGPAVTVNSKGEEIQNVSGEFTHGVSVSPEGYYTIGYMNSGSFSTATKSVDFFKMQFEVIDPTHPTTDIEFYCKEYYSVSEQDKNITPDDGLQPISINQSVPTLEAPKMMEVVGHIAGLKVKWAPANGAIGYVVYRKTVTTDWEEVAQVGGESSSEYIDSDIVSGTTYIYTVSAVNNYGESTKDKIGISCEYIAKPTIISLKNVVGGIELSWTPTDGAKSYNLYRRIKGETEWTLLSNRLLSSGTTYKDTFDLVDGTTYEYDVNSVASSYESANYPEGSSVTYVTTPVVSIEIVAEGIRLQWKANPGATKYDIYRKISGQQSELTYYKSTTDTSFIDTDVVAGFSYTYSIKVIAGDSESAYNPTGYTTTYVPPTPVKSLTLTANGVTVTWDVVENAAGYSIYRKPASSGNWVKVATLVKTVTSFDDTDVGSGANYVYAVCPIINGAESAKLQSSPIYVIKAPANVKTENVDDGVMVTWDSVSGTVTYIIYRSENGSEFQPVAEISSLYTRAYLDENVVLGGKYAYAIKCVGDSAESFPSDGNNQIIRISAIGKATPVISDGGILVTWDAVDGVSQYAVFRDRGNGFVLMGTVDEPRYLDTKVESNTTYSYAVAAVVDGSRGILNTDAPIQLLYVAPTAKITITNYSGYSQIVWEAVDGATGYELYRTVGDDTLTPELVATFGSDTLKYVDKDVVGGEDYYYFLRTKNAEGMSALSSGKKNTYLEVPQITSIGNAYGGITFSWKAVAGATGYRVYRKVYGATYYTYIETVSADTLSYTDTGAENGKIMCYCIKAENEGSMSAYLAKCYTYVKAPEIRFSNSPSGVYLTWDKNPSAVGYWIYRKTPGAKSWTRIACVTTTYYTDKKVESGGAYIYTMRAYTGKILSHFNPDGWQIVHLSTPVMKAPGLGYGAVTCFWNPVAGAEGYYVYRKVDDKGNWTYIGKTSATLFRDVNVTNGSKYTYTVKAYYGNSTSSFDYNGKSTKYLVAPTLTVSNNISGVYLSWNRVSGADKYYIYRKEGNATSWTRIAVTSKTYYTDTTAKSGKVYTYTIKSYNSSVTSGYNSYGWKTYYLNSPKLNSATSYPGGITVRWQKVTGATWYSVYRKEGTGSWVRIGTTTGNGSVSFTDTTAVVGKRYTYTVRACYGSYISSFYTGVSCTSNY